MVSQGSTRQSVEDIQDWDNIAETYMHQISGAEDRIYEQFKVVMWESLGNLNGQEVLDVGCGHGWFSQAMFEAGAHVIGIDGSNNLLAHARSNNPDIDFIQHELASGLPPLDRSFDRIIAYMVLMDIPEIGPLVTAVREVLKPGGRFIFTIPHPCFFNYKARYDKEAAQWIKGVHGYLTQEVWRIEGFGGHNHYHRSLTYYFDQLRMNQLVVTRFYEPTHIPGTRLEDEEFVAFCRNIPIFLLFETQRLSDESNNRPPNHSE
jgi:2-polyprenyl-3-methyl-5-hydroxy-6-metoxy-1,4-benzoquinol methylase